MHRLKCTERFEKNHEKNVKQVVLNCDTAAWKSAAFVSLWIFYYYITPFFVATHNRYASNHSARWEGLDARDLFHLCTMTHVPTLNKLIYNWFWWIRKRWSVQIVLSHTIGSVLISQDPMLWCSGVRKPSRNSSPSILARPYIPPALQRGAWTIRLVGCSGEKKWKGAVGEIKLAVCLGITAS